MMSSSVSIELLSPAGVGRGSFMVNGQEMDMAKVSVVPPNPAKLRLPNLALTNRAAPCWDPSSLAFHS